MIHFTFWKFSTPIATALGGALLVLEKVALSQYSLDPYFVISILKVVLIVSGAELIFGWILDIVRQAAAEWMMVAYLAHFLGQTMLILGVTGSIPNVPVVVAVGIDNSVNWLAILLCLIIAATIVCMSAKKSKLQKTKNTPKGVFCLV